MWILAISKHCIVQTKSSLDPFLPFFYICAVATLLKDKKQTTEIILLTSITSLTIIHLMLRLRTCVSNLQHLPIVAPAVKSPVSGTLVERPLLYGQKKGNNSKREAILYLTPCVWSISPPLWACGAIIQLLWPVYGINRREMNWGHACMSLLWQNQSFISESDFQSPIKSSQLGLIRLLKLILHFNYLDIKKPFSLTTLGHVYVIVWSSYTNKSHYLAIKWHWKLIQLI